MNYKPQIKLAMNMHEMIANKRLPTDQEWDNYFIKTYNNNTLFIWSGDEFLSYQVFHDCVFIHDFVSHRSGISLVRQAFQIAKDMGLPTRCLIHVSNIKVLNVLMHRYGFKIKELTGIQYLMERKWADHQGI